MYTISLSDTCSNMFLSIKVYFNFSHSFLFNLKVTFAIFISLFMYFLIYLLFVYNFSYITGRRHILCRRSFVNYQVRHILKGFFLCTYLKYLVFLFLSCFFLFFSISEYNGSKQVFLGVEFFTLLHVFEICFVLFWQY